MNNLVIDLTHGGVKIATSLAKKGKSVLAYDIYNTLSDMDAKMLETSNVELIQLDDLKDLEGDMNVIYPIHLPLSLEEITSYNPNLNYTFQTHHEIIMELLEGWGEDILKIEVTGVKGKTTSVFMLKEILIDENPLILSSLGALLYDNKREIVLKRNISITPANIKETVDLAYKIANPVCEIADGTVESENLRKYNSAIFESSLGVSGIGDVGLLLNIKCVCIQKEALDKYYCDVDHGKTNTFSLKDTTANLFVKEIDYNLNQTSISLEYRNVKTVNDNVVSGNMDLMTFALGPHHVSNVLGVVLTCLSLEIPEEKIVGNIKNYKGIPGRTNKRIMGNSIIIEEINPGLNTQAIKESINMIDDIDDYYISIGGDYGITCEEIDEEKLSEFLNTLNRNVILTGDLGLSLSKKLTAGHDYFKDYHEAYDMALKNDKNLLFIYRSDYRKVSQR